MTFRKPKTFQPLNSNLVKIHPIFGSFIICTMCGDLVSVTIPLLFCSITTKLDDQLDSRSISISFCSQLLFSRFSYFRFGFAAPTHTYPVIVMVRLQMCLEKGAVTAEAECYFSELSKRKEGSKQKSLHS